MVNIEERFIPRKRTALDGKAWWCIWDEKSGNWSTYILHGKYRTKKLALYAIRSTLQPLHRL